MSLKDDLEAMERHSRRGTLKEWFEGTAELIPLDTRMPPDPSAKSIKNLTAWLRARGE